MLEVKAFLTCTVPTTSTYARYIKVKIFTKLKIHPAVNYRLYDMIMNIFGSFIEPL